MIKILSKAGARGPSLLEDFLLREKITHFDHERIPERIVHARGTAAHGYFQVYKSPVNQDAGLRALLNRGWQRPALVRCVGPQNQSPKGDQVNRILDALAFNAIYCL